MEDIQVEVNGKIYTIEINNGHIGKMYNLDNGTIKNIPQEEVKDVLLAAESKLKGIKSINSNIDIIKNLIETKKINTYREYSEYLKNLNLSDENLNYINDNLKPFLSQNLTKDFDFNDLLIENQEYLKKSKNENEKLITTIVRNGPIINYNLSVYNEKTGETKLINEKKLDFNYETKEFFIKGIAENFQKVGEKESSNFESRNEGMSVIADYSFINKNNAIFNLNGFEKNYSLNIKEITEEYSHEMTNDNIKNENEISNETTNDIEYEEAKEKKEEKGYQRIKKNVTKVSNNIHGNINKSFYYILMMLSIILVYIIYLIITLL